MFYIVHVLINKRKLDTLRIRNTNIYVLIVTPNSQHDINHRSSHRDERHVTCKPGCDEVFTTYDSQNKVRRFTVRGGWKSGRLLSW